MRLYDFLPVVAVYAALAALLGFLFPDGGWLPVNKWPFASERQAVRFTAWAMTAISVVSILVWLFGR